MRTTIGIATFLAVGAGAVGVSALNLRGSDTLKDLTIRLLTSATLECGGVGEPTTDAVPGTLVYEGTGSGNGQAAMIGGTQDVGPMSSRMSTDVCATAPGKAEGIVFALDGISIVARDTTAQNSAGACNGSKVGCNVDNPKKGLRSTFAGDAGAPPPALTSCVAGQIVDWRDVLRLIYFGYDASNLTTQNCNSPCRAELANGYAKLFQSSCTVGNSCTQLKHAFRRNDESGTTDVFSKALGVPGINQKNNFSPFCNNATTGPAINSPALVACTTSADCNPGGLAGGSCDTNAASRTFHQCIRLACNGANVCPGGAPCVASGANTICDFEANTSPQVNIANHLLGGCEGNADCGAGQTCDFISNIGSSTNASCTCGVAADCPAGTGTACTGGHCTYTASTPQPGHIVESNTTTGYGNATAGSSWVDVQDSDPIRRTCSRAAGGLVSEHVCNRDGRLGLVLPIWDATTDGSTVPNVPAVTSADAFPAIDCDTAKWDCYDANAFARDAGGNSIYDRCPDGTNPNAASGTNLCPPHQCAVPVAGAAKDRRCRNTPGNLPPPLIASASLDGRVFNLTVWQQLPSTQFVMGRYPRNTGQLGTSLYGTTGFVAMQGAFFRLHYQTPTISGSPPCQATSATDQIGCFVQASWCSFGYAGNSAVNGATVSVNVNNVPPDDNTCVQNLINLPANDPATYRISRRLFLNSVKGFESIDPGIPANAGESNDKKNQYKMAQCFGLNDDGAGPHGEAAGIAVAAPPTGFGFIPLGIAPFCDDVALNVCGQTAACPNNTGAIPVTSIAF